MERAYTEWSNLLEQELLALVRQAPPEFLERLVVKLLINMGYGGGDPERGVRTGRSGDGGIDGMIGQDALGLDKVYFQAKRYAKGTNVSSSEIQQFVGSLAGRGMNKGVFVTTSDFTESAKRAANASNQFHVELLDGESLARLMVAHDVGVREGTVYNLKRIDTDYFERDQGSSMLFPMSRASRRGG